VIDTATRHMRLAEDHGLSIRWAVNVSALDLLSSDFAGRVTQAMAATGLPTERLVIEVTESAAMTDPEHAIRQLAALRLAGIKLSIDDYGTGHASMAQLKRLPVDELKIDRSFVRHLAADPKDEAIVSSTITLAHRLGLSVVAEGVEDAATAARLAAIGCDEIQGYGVARPMPVAELAGWVERSRAAVRAFVAGGVA
jgi:EAL domain-containing protein (putative c-di-GMP-specific phosphodiesterase class I)